MFASNAANLVANDTNGAADVFVRRLSPSSGATTTPLAAAYEPSPVARASAPTKRWRQSPSQWASLVLTPPPSGEPTRIEEGARLKKAL